MTGPSVLMAAAEALPFIKTGGLGDVMGALPPCLAAAGVRVRVVIPHYPQVERSPSRPRPWRTGLHIDVGNTTYLTDIYKTTVNPDYEVYSIRHDPFFDRPQPYGPPGGEYVDNARRFAFFCHAVAALADLLDPLPDVVHCHDWQTALLPLLLGERFPTLFTIHNIGYQGRFPKEDFAGLGLPAGSFHPGGLEFWGGVNFLKAGIVWSDAVTTVSPTHALEIATPEFGFGLDGLLCRQRGKLSGILNGVDYGAWDPAVDPFLPERYRAGDLSGKAACRAALLAEVGLPAGHPGPLIGMTTRLEEQKGVDLVLDALPSMLEDGAAVVILGTGQPHLEAALGRAAKLHPHLAVRLAFDEGLAHRIMAGADLFLMPSRYEPCGLNQLYAQRYGTLPVVRATGGLADSVEQVDAARGTGTGILFGLASAETLRQAVRQASGVWRDESLRVRIQANGMARDFSWRNPADGYRRLYGDIAAGLAGHGKERAS